LDCAAAFVTQHNNKPRAQMLDGIFDTAQGVIIHQVSRVEPLGSGPVRLNN